MASTISAEELFHAHAGFAASFLHRLGVPNRDVPDLVQEVFLLAHQKGGFVDDGRAKPRTWIAAIAVRLASGYRRKRKEELSDVEPGMTTRTPEVEVSTRRSRQRLTQCLDGLDVEHRSVFVLFEVEGMRSAEIAETLGVPVGTIYSRLHHARARVREAYVALGRGTKPIAEGGGS